MSGWVGPTAHLPRETNSRCYDPIKASIFRGGRLALVLSPSWFCFLFRDARSLLWTALYISETQTRIIQHIYSSSPRSPRSPFANHILVLNSLRILSRRKDIFKNLIFFTIFVILRDICIIRDIICGIRICRIKVQDYNDIRGYATGVLAFHRYN